MKDNIKILIAILVVVVVGYFGYQFFNEDSSGDKNNADRSEEVQTETEAELAVKELGNKHNALVGWNNGIRYTAQLQELLVDSNKPVVFAASVDDVFKKDGQYYIRFITGDFWSTLWSGGSSEAEIRFDLACDQSHAEAIINSGVTSSGEIPNPFSIFGTYVVVAKVDSVTKLTLQITGYSTEYDEEVELEYEPSDVFSAKGNCIDLKYVEGNSDNIF